MAYLGGADLRANHVERVALLLDPERLHDVAHHAARIVVVIDGELPRVAQKVSVLASMRTHMAWNVHTHMPRVPSGNRAAQTLAHLSRGLVGKGDGEDLPRTDTEVGDHVGDAIGEHARLARAGAREHQERPLSGEDGLALGGVERVDVDGRRAPRGSGRRGVVDVERDLFVDRGGGCRAASDAPAVWRGGGARRASYAVMWCFQGRGCETDMVVSRQDDTKAAAASRGLEPTQYTGPRGHRRRAVEEGCTRAARGTTGTTAARGGCR